MHAPSPLTWAGLGGLGLVWGEAFLAGGGAEGDRMEGGGGTSPVPIPPSGICCLAWEYKSRIWWQISLRWRTEERRSNRNRRKIRKAFIVNVLGIVWQYSHYLPALPQAHHGQTAPTSAGTTAWRSSPGCQTYRDVQPDTWQPQLWSVAPTAGPPWCKGLGGPQWILLLLLFP